MGLNAGGKNKAASAYYLPLERVVRALQLIQASKDVTAPVHVWPKPVIPRGDLQTTFLFKGFDEVRRSGPLPSRRPRTRCWLLFAGVARSPAGNPWCDSSTCASAALFVRLHATAGSGCARRRSAACVRPTRSRARRTVRATTWSVTVQWQVVQVAQHMQLCA